MNHHSLSDFRVGHADWLDGELTRSIAGLLAAGVIGFEQVAQDGLRIRASAGVNSFRKLPSLAKAQRLAEQQVRGLKQELEADPTAGSRRRQAAQQRAAADRQARVKAALAAMDEAQARKRRNKGKAGEAKVSTTDPQARIMRMPDGGFRPAYNLQLVAEAEHGLVGGLAVSCSGADQDNLLPMADQVAERYGCRPAHWLADGGYAGKAAIEALSRAGIAAHIPCAGLAAGARPESPAIQAWRERMGSEAGKLCYRRRAAVIERVDAGCRHRGLYATNLRSAAKLRAVGLWHALAHNRRVLWRVPVPA